MGGNTGLRDGKGVWGGKKQGFWGLRGGFLCFWMVGDFGNFWIIFAFGCAGSARFGWFCLFWLFFARGVFVYLAVIGGDWG